MNAEYELREQSESEKSVIGALLIMPELYPSVSEIISGSDFYYPLNREIFENMSELYRTSGKCDLTLLIEKTIVSNESKRDASEIKEYLIRLSDAVPVISNIMYYCEIMRQKSTAREAAGIVTEIMRIGFYRGGETGEIILSAAEKLSKIARTEKRGGGRKIKSVLEENYNDIFGNGEDLSVKTGIGELDRILDGIYPGDLITIAAATSVGKTSFMLQIVKNIAKSGKKVILYSQEMTARQNTLRLIANQSGVDMRKLKKPGRLDDAEKTTVGKAFDELYRLPIEVNDVGGITVEDIRHDLISSPETDVIVIDHIGLMSMAGGLKSKSLYEQVTQNMKELRALASRTNRVIIILAQFNREGNKYKAEPDLSCLRDSGEIEQSSTAVIVLWRTEDYEGLGIIGVSVAKNRQGGTGKFNMRFDAAKMNFVEVSYDYAPPKKYDKTNKKAEEIFGL